MVVFVVLPLPTALFQGAGEQWREGQELAIRRAVDCRKRWIVLGLPVGSGKSLVGMSIARLTGARTLILTSTRGLQEQYAQTFGPVLHDIRGMRNYPCAELLDRGGRDTTCDLGPCLDGEECVYLAGGCAYFDALRDAGAADIVLTNYAMYYALQETGRVGLLGERDLLICDEAHDAASGLGGFAGAHFGPKDILFPNSADNLSIHDWRSWAIAHRQSAEQVEAKALPSRERRAFRRLVRELGKLAECPDDWVPEWRYGAGWAFEPVWVQSYTRQYLWRDHRKVVLLSATLRPETAERELGLEEGSYEYYEAPSTFPKERRPIIHVKTVRVNHRMSDWARERWVDRVDEIAETRNNPGVIHTVSYERARELVAKSRHAARMLLPRSAGETRQAVEHFRKGSSIGVGVRSAPILVSPSVHTGYDFPDHTARWQIVVKVPYPDTRSGLAYARQADDPDYAARTAITTLVQMCGRIVRGPEDWGETLVIDDHISHLVARYAHLFPRWWRESYSSTDEVPEPLNVD